MRWVMRVGLSGKVEFWDRRNVWTFWHSDVWGGRSIWTFRQGHYWSWWSNDLGFLDVNICTIARSGSVDFGIYKFKCT